MLDTIASRVYGLVTAKDCRVVWMDGWLYVARSPSDIAAFECPAPKKYGGIWKTLVGESAISFTPPGCGSCRRRVQASPLGQMTVEQIVAAVSIDA